MTLFQPPVQVTKTQSVKQLDASSANMPSFPVVSEILSFVTTSVSVTYGVFYPQGIGSHFSRAKCLSMVMLTVRGNKVPLRHTSERDSKCSFTLTCTFSNTYTILANKKIIKCYPGQSVLYLTI